MTLSPRRKRTLYQILPFGIISFVFSTVYTLLEKGILGDFPLYPATGNPYVYNWFVPAVAAGIFGTLIGLLEAAYISKWFKKNSFYVKIVLKSSIYLLLMVLLAMLVSSVAAGYELKARPFSGEVWAYTKNFFTCFAFRTIVVYITMGIVTSLFYVEVSNIIGQNVLINLFTGKYHTPFEEKRIFMFLDMKSSTTIAEQLGHVKYFKLLQSYYADISDAIIDHGGSIYQYVGDEVVIMWKLKTEKDIRPLHCFWAMEKALIEKKNKYLKRYGLAPTFKAGIHVGVVTTGEIGKIKKDIVFTGDVLNTAARIQGLCNTYGVNLLFSEQFAQIIETHEDLAIKALGETELRGKGEKVRLFTIKNV